MSDKIRLTLATGHDPKVETHTECGIVYGEEGFKEVSLSIEEARELLQSEVISKLDYHEATEFYKKYSK